MSESVSAPDSGAMADAPAAAGDLSELVKALDIEEHAPDASETSDREVANVKRGDDSGEELPDGIPATDRLKINGKEVERTYAEIKAAAQKYEATEIKLDQAKKQLEEAKGLQAKVGEQQNLIRNILGVLQKGDLDTVGEFVRNYLHAGDVFDQAIVKYALKLYEYDRLSPAEKEAYQNKLAVERYRKEAEERQRLDQDRAFEYRVNQWSEHIATEVPKAIAEVGLVDSPFVREHIVGAWRNAIERGLNPTAKAVAAWVKQRLEEAKVTFAPAEPAPEKAPPQRKRATAESVGLRRGNGAEPQPYMSFSDWQKTRGR